MMTRRLALTVCLGLIVFACQCAPTFAQRGQRGQGAQGGMRAGQQGGFGGGMFGRMGRGGSLDLILRDDVKEELKLTDSQVESLEELRRARMLINEIMEDLEDAGQNFDREIQVGMMVEVPATVIVLDRFIKEVDFISIGTNDLIQYTLAVDRGNKDVASLYNASEPAVLRLLDASIQTANSGLVHTSLCGQMSADPKYTQFLLGLGNMEGPMEKL